MPDDPPHRDWSLRSHGFVTLKRFLWRVKPASSGSSGRLRVDVMVGGNSTTTTNSGETSERGGGPFTTEVYTDMMQVEAEVNLKQVICETYKGDKPASCAGVGITRHDSTYLKAHAARLGIKNWRANQSG
ncbi:hypothetical protein GWK47_025005 [Chionoecetes opilio]|uniref:Uncharacterized protein n=1 Tax=Chionoecetes opilio TaxID=41210 RepID=A0A8J4XUZ1_CHIOP|nr:hypothetical protein GWK47_025005 [Chionoecetes opilio]